MAARKKTTETVETIEKTFDETNDVKVEDIALVDEVDEENDNITNIAPEVTEDKITEEDTLSNSFSKLADTIAKAVEKKTNEPKSAPTKKPFKLGLWGYLALVVVVKGAVEITKAVADSKKPRR